MEVRSANQSARQASASVLPTKDLTRLSGLAGKLINQRTIRFDNIAGASSLTMLGTWPVLLEVQSSSSSAPTSAAAKLLIRVVSTAACGAEPFIAQSNAPQATQNWTHKL